MATYDVVGRQERPDWWSGPHLPPCDVYVFIILFN